MKTVVNLLIVLVALTGCKEGQSVNPDLDITARYTVTFQSTWSATSHPVDFPASAHFSGLIGATHSHKAVFWSSGIPATSGPESAVPSRT